jgi:hypothetical protein
MVAAQVFLAQGIRNLVDVPHPIEKLNESFVMLAVGMAR